jgi:carbon-monoxide dehydrogenase small subunit
VSEDFQVTLRVNGTTHQVEVEARRLLADVLRHDLRLTGTHVGCEHGVCGACTVLVDGQLVRSCLTFAVQCDGAVIETVEGLAQGDQLGTIQQAFADRQALQCGFCTAGFLMLAKCFVDRESRVSRQEVEEAVGSNLCRCTGYHRIVDAVEDLSRRADRAGRDPRSGGGVDD